MSDTKKNEVVDLPEQFTIATVSEVSESLLPLLENAAKATINCAQVVRVDAAALQLLASFVKTAKESHLEFSFSDPSQKMIEAAEVIGINEYLEI